MVHDRLDNLGLYLPESCRSAILKYLSGVSPDMPEGQTAIEGDAVYARVMSYPTLLPEACVTEAHNVYVDIQFTLTGGEGISVFPREELRAIAADDGKDFYTYEAAGQPAIRAMNLPGWFTMLFPHEAHRPKESLDGKCGIVKKGVIKIKMDCFR